MTPLQRQFALKEKGITQCQIARKLGVHEMSVSDVIRGVRVSDRIMRGIAAAIGRDHRAVFPEYYFQAPKRSTSKARGRV